jgi:hypothetical protein
MPRDTRPVTPVDRMEKISWFLLSLDHKLLFVKRSCVPRLSPQFFDICRFLREQFQFF